MHAIIRAALIAAALLPAVAAAQSYPNRPVRLVVPYPPGGPTDLIGRATADLLSKRLGQQVIVDNRGGAATVIGAEIVARAPNDGYTLLVATVTTLAVTPSLRKKLPYDPERDFAPITMLAAQPYLLAVTNALPATSVKQLIAHAKANPGKLSFGSAGVGAGAHLAGEMLKHLAGLDVVHVPYKGTGPAITDLISGQIAYMFGGISAINPHVQAGRLRALAVSSAKRSASLPDMPTIAEGGVPGYGTSSWNSLVAPRGTPPAILARLNADTVAALNEPAVRDRLRTQGIDTEPGTPAELAAHIKAERARFEKLIQAIGLQAG
jgi:tripartite-type tricarboxylate transporter receptor subunit TctC